MSGQFEATVEVDRPVEEVFAYLADGRNDPQFSPRVLKIERVPDAPTTVGTVFRSTVKDAGMKTAREFRNTDLTTPSRIRWAEVSKNSVTVSEGGYDLEPLADGRTRVRIFNVLEGHGLGKLHDRSALRCRSRTPGVSRRTTLRPGDRSSPPYEPIQTLRYNSVQRGNT